MVEVVLAPCLEPEGMGVRSQEPQQAQQAILLPVEVAGAVEAGILSLGALVQLLVVFPLVAEALPPVEII
jgi:hypothetical protein